MRQERDASNAGRGMGRWGEGERAGGRRGGRGGERGKKRKLGKERGPRGSLAWGPPEA